jgi:hypothetical protein
MARLQVRAERRIFMTSETNLKIRCHLACAINLYENCMKEAEKMDDDYDCSLGIGEPQTKATIMKYWQDEIKSAQSLIAELESAQQN